MAKSVCHINFEAALGKKITKERLEVLRGEVNIERSQMWVKEPAVMAAMSDAQQDASALRQIIARKATDLLVRQKQIIETAQKQKEMLGYAERMYVERGLPAIESIARFAFHRADFGHTENGGGVQSMASVYTTIRQQSMARILQALDAAGGYTNQFLGMLANKEQTHKLMMEDRGLDSKDPVAKAIIKAIHAEMDGNLQRFKELGGRKNEMTDYSLQSHDKVMMLKDKQGWKSDVIKGLDKSKFKNMDGSDWTPERWDTFLDEAWYSLVYGGNDGTTTSTTAGIANKQDVHRQLHFTPQGYLDYHEKWGGNGFMEMVDSHISYQAKEIAILKKFGPGGLRNFETTLHAVAKQDRLRGFKKTDKHIIYWTAAAKDFMYGEHTPTEHLIENQWFGAARSFLYSGLMGSAAIPAIVMDNLNVQIGNTLNGTTAAQYTYAYAKMLGIGSKEAKEASRLTGVGVETYLAEMNRFMNESGLATGGHHLSAQAKSVGDKATSLVMTVTGNNRHTKAGRAAIGNIHNALWSDILVNAKDFNSFITNDDSKALTTKGFTEQDFKILQEAAKNRSKELLASNDIANLSDDVIRALIGEPDASQATINEARRQANDVYFGSLIEQANHAVYQPLFQDGFDVRNVLNNRMPGAWGPRLNHSVSMFMTFMWGMNRSHWDTYRSYSGMNANRHLTKYMASVLVGGGLLMILDDLRNGRDPREAYDPEKPISSLLNTAVQALLRGGGGGIYGSIFLGDTDESKLMGPLVSTAYGLTIEPAMGLIKESNKDDPNYGKVLAKAVNKGFAAMPGQNIWWASAAFNRGIKYELLSYLDPEYYDKLNKNVERYYGSEYFYDVETGELRAPDFGNIVKD